MIVFAVITTIVFLYPMLIEYEKNKNIRSIQLLHLQMNNITSLLFSFSLGLFIIGKKSYLNELAVYFTIFLVYIEMYLIFKMKISHGKLTVDCINYVVNAIVKNSVMTVLLVC